jgi:hypothetical protein
MMLLDKIRQCLCLEADDCDSISNKLYVSDFSKKVFIFDDEYLNTKSSYVIVMLFEIDREPQFILDSIAVDNKQDLIKIASIYSIAYITYRMSTGQIGLINVKEQYRNKGLGKDMLKMAINKLLKTNTYVWAVSNKNNPFWENVFSKSFRYTYRPHTSVTGSGYSLDVDKWRKIINNY